MLMALQQLQQAQEPKLSRFCITNIQVCDRCQGSRTLSSPRFTKVIRKVFWDHSLIILYLIIVLVSLLVKLNNFLPIALFYGYYYFLKYEDSNIYLSRMFSLCPLVWILKMHSKNKVKK